MNRWTPGAIIHRKTIAASDSYYLISRAPGGDGVGGVHAYRFYRYLGNTKITTFDPEQLIHRKLLREGEIVEALPDWVPVEYHMLAVTLRGE